MKNHNSKWGQLEQNHIYQCDLISSFKDPLAQVNLQDK